MGNDVPGPFEITKFGFYTRAIENAFINASKVVHIDENKLYPTSRLLLILIILEILISESKCWRNIFSLHLSLEALITKSSFKFRVCLILFKNKII